jgi:hypothetical protein
VNGFHGRAERQRDQEDQCNTPQDGAQPTQPSWPENPPLAELGS